MHELTSQILSHLRAAWRYRWAGMAFAWVAALGGWIGVYVTPNRFEASARVYVDTQSVLRPLLAGLAMQPNVDQIVSMMSRTLVSRPNLEKVIRMADLEINLKTPEDREKLIESMTKLLEIKSAGRENLFTISYSDKNPQQAKRVVQSLLTIFVEGSLGDKRKDSDSARRFIDEQLKAYAEKLTAAENAVTEFKQRNMGLMPGQGQNFYTRLAEARTLLNQARLELNEAENGRDAIKRQLTSTDDLPPSLLEEQPLAEPATNPEIDARIQGLQQKLDALRLTFTERHPDIIAISRMMDQLKEQKSKEQKLKEEKLKEQKQQQARQKKPSPAAQSQNPIFQQLSVSLAEAEATVASLKARVAEYEKRLKEINLAANSIPKVEADYVQLTRDYDVTRGNYEKLLSRRESAQISGDMEANTSVVDFRVVDPPQVPLVPNWPKRPLLMSLVLAAALAGGLGFAFLLSQLRPTINDERKLRDLSAGLPVFGSVIMAWPREYQVKRKKGLIVLLASFLSLLSAYAAVMAALLLTASRA